ncbi:phosphotransferase [Actinomadura sp. BRA 177]|uniref:phosphotransferase n=1 Tax=Actinomadura sp. BRA 177 TaxID=2745202 RepID=UPI001595C6AA|nr:phosphotransferase [Actinomadura sp. BRA 177]NVI90595.1 phosphotransferase [Actinomadura sp. BRA 177]
MHDTWARLPDEILDAITERTGQVCTVRAAFGGSNTDLAVTVTGPAGRTFVKAAPKVSPDEDSPRVRALRREAAINPCVPEFAPRLLWTAEAGGWLAVGFEHIRGRHADYSPGNPDLLALAETVHRLQAVPCPEVVVMRVERRWEALAKDVSPMAGEALLHTDLNPHNLLITADGQVRVVDWAFASRGAAWVEIGQVVPWLIRAGHSPAEAEWWAEQFPSWADADPAAIDLHARLSAERWGRYSDAHPTSHVPAYLAVARRWAAHRHG